MRVIIVVAHSLPISHIPVSLDEEEGPESAVDTSSSAGICSAIDPGGVETLLVIDFSKGGCVTPTGTFGGLCPWSNRSAFRVWDAFTARYAV